MNIALESILAKLPILEIQATLQSHTEPLMEMLPDKRMKKVLKNMVLGILGGQTPIVTRMACQLVIIQRQYNSFRRSPYNIPIWRIRRR